MTALTSPREHMVLSALTSLAFLLDARTQGLIRTPEVHARVSACRAHASARVRLMALAVQPDLFPELPPAT